MHTPTHAALNFLVLGRGRSAPRGWILLGAVLPDLPMLAFFVYEAVFCREPPARIFGVLYFEPGWQTLFDAFHSIPISLAMLGWSLWRRSRVGAFFAASLLLHSLIDWPTHLEDAHAYFWPILRRPLPGVVSYWHAESSLWIFELGFLAAAIAFLTRERLSGPLRPPLRA
ncbi:MAG: hypothetical protein ABW298_02130 [Candidatus Binatia bacterium]